MDAFQPMYILSRDPQGTSSLYYFRFYLVINLHILLYCERKIQLKSFSISPHCIAVWFTWTRERLREVNITFTLIASYLMSDSLSIALFMLRKLRRVRLQTFDLIVYPHRQSMVIFNFLFFYNKFSRNKLFLKVQSMGNGDAGVIGANALLNTRGVFEVVIGFVIVQRQNTMENIARWVNLALR